MRGGAGKDAPDGDAKQLVKVGQRVNAFESQFSETVPTDLDLLRLAGAEQGAGVLGEIEVHVDGARLTEITGGEDGFGLADGGEGVPAPHQEPHAGALDGCDNPVAVGETERQRLVLDDVQAGLGSLHGEGGVAGHFRRDARDLRLEAVQRGRYAREIREAEGGGGGRIACVRPIGRGFIVGHGE